MNRAVLKSELKKVGISLDGWLPVMQCDACKHRWEPFTTAVGSSAPTARLYFWKCPNQCNATAQPGREVETAVPRYLIIKDIPGMIFGDEDLAEFERYVLSMD